MAYLKIKNIDIKGVSACLPKEIEYNRNYPYFEDNEIERMLETTGIEKHHIAPKGVTASDLAYQAAEQLISELGWDKSEIGIIVYCGPARDYIFPDTACILQDRLGLSKSCMAFDMTLGCTGWTYGLNVVSSLLGNCTSKKALLLNGSLTSLENAYTDKTAYPLFSDAGSATAIEYNENVDPIISELGTDGSGYDKIILRAGGYRNPFTKESLDVHDYGEGVIRSNLNMAMNGMDVFAFAINTAPKSIKNLLEYIKKDVDDVDNFFFHQANLFMVKRIIKKLKINPDIAPFSIYQFGNTGCCSIPVTMVTEKADFLRENKSKNIGCAFGVGLSWASVYFETENLVIPDLILY